MQKWCNITARWREVPSEHLHQGAIAQCDVRELSTPTLNRLIQGLPVAGIGWLPDTILSRSVIVRSAQTIQPDDVRGQIQDPRIAVVQQNGIDSVTYLLTGGKKGNPWDARKNALAEANAQLQPAVGCGSISERVVALVADVADVQPRCDGRHHATFDGLIDAKFGLKAQYWPSARFIFHPQSLKRITN